MIEYLPRYKRKSSTNVLHVITLFLIIASTVLADDIRRHGLSLHAGGAASFFEYEYQYKLVAHEKLSISATAGVNTSLISFGFPVGLNVTYGQKNQLLLGLRFIPDVLVISFDEEVIVPYWNYYANLRVGYGRELSIFNQKFTMYLYASPLINLTRDSNFLWGGLALTRYF